MWDQIKRVGNYARCAAALGVSPAEKWAIFWKQTKNVRVQFKFGAYHPDTIYTLRTIYGPLHFRDNFGDITNLIKLIYQAEYRFRELAAEGAILDVGANIGLAAAWFSFHNPSRRICCFEPLADNAALIRLNCPQAEIHQAAVGARPGRMTLRVDPDNIMASSIPNPWASREVAFDVITLDEFARAHSLDHIALLKMDAEGMEDEILEGARDVLSKTKHVVMETHGRQKHNAVIAMLLEHGFGVDSESFSKSTGLVFASRRPSR